jgi:hypothetical protein
MRANQNPSRELSLYLKSDLTHLFYFGQDCIAIEELSVLKTGLETIAETRIDVDKNTCETDDKNRIKN